MLNRTRLGQRIQAVGANKEAARLAGIRTDRVKITAFVIAGVCAPRSRHPAGLAARQRHGQRGDGYLWTRSPRCSSASATLRDGEFHILGTLVGVLVVNVGFNGLSLLGTPTFWQFIFKGGILVLAVALSTVARRYAKT